MAEHNKLGQFGEQAVVDRLVAEGYTIVERNWRMNHLEIDIIATRGEEIVFVEVKTRRNSDSNPLDAITPRKIALLCRAADIYIRIRGVRLNPRFDVASVIGDEHSFTIDYITDAIRPPLRTY